MNLHDVFILKGNVGMDATIRGVFLTRQDAENGMQEELHKCLARMSKRRGGAKIVKRSTTGWDVASYYSDGARRLTYLTCWIERHALRGSPLVALAEQAE